MHDVVEQLPPIRKIAADAGQKIATLANGEAAAQKDQEKSNTANTALLASE